MKLEHKLSRVLVNWLIILYMLNLLLILLIVSQFNLIYTLALLMRTRSIRQVKHLSPLSVSDREDMP